MWQLPNYEKRESQKMTHPKMSTPPPPSTYTPFATFIAVVYLLILDYSLLEWRIRDLFVNICIIQHFN